MARIRTVKPEFWVDEKVVELDPWARLLFIGLWNFADDRGYIDFAPKRIKMQVFPGDTVDVGPLLDALLEQGLLRAYMSPIGPVLHVVHWARHQKVDNPSKARFDEAELVPLDPREPPRGSREAVLGLVAPPNGSNGRWPTPADQAEKPRESSLPLAGAREDSERRSDACSNDDGVGVDAAPALFVVNSREDSRTLAAEGKGREGKGKGALSAAKRSSTKPAGAEQGDVSAPKGAAAPTVHQRASSITDAYHQLEPMSKWPAVNAIVKRAISSGRYADDDIRAAVLRLAAAGRSVTVDALRIELQPGTGRGSSHQGYRDPVSADVYRKAL